MSEVIFEKIVRVRILIFIIIAASYAAAFVIGLSITPSQSYLERINEAVKANERLVEALKENVLALLSFKLVGVIVELGPSLLPIYGLWHASKWLINAGIFIKALYPHSIAYAIFDLILQALILAMPATDGLLASFIGLLAIRAKSAEYKAFALHVFRWYIASALLALTLISLMALIS